MPRCRSPNPCLPQQQDTIPYAAKISVLRSWRWAKDCPKHVELILEINKLLLLHLVGSSILLYLNWWCTVKHKSGLAFLFTCFGRLRSSSGHQHNILKYGKMQYVVYIVTICNCTFYLQLNFVRLVARWRIIHSDTFIYLEWKNLCCVSTEDLLVSLRTQRHVL